MVTAGRASSSKNLVENPEPGTSPCKCECNATGGGEGNSSKEYCSLGYYFKR
jgi:hypothetical protein